MTVFALTAAGVSWLLMSLRAEHANSRRSLHGGLSDAPGRDSSPRPRPGNNAPWLEAGFVGVVFCVGLAMESGWL